MVAVVGAALLVETVVVGLPRLVVVVLALADAVLKLVVTAPTGMVVGGVAVAPAAASIVVRTVVVTVVVVVAVVVVVVVEVVVEVVVVDEGRVGPVIRGGPMSSKCMPSGMLQVPPQANPFRRNT